LQEVLKVERVGIYENFFELGGHSLLATQIISRINQQFAVEVALRKLFEAPSIEGLSTVIGESNPYQAVPIASMKRFEQLFAKPEIPHRGRHQTESSNSTKNKEKQEISRRTEEHVVRGQTNSDDKKETNDLSNAASTPDTAFL
jgi:acyl carrier protein